MIPHYSQLLLVVCCNHLIHSTQRPLILSQLRWADMSECRHVFVDRRCGDMTRADVYVYIKGLEASVTINFKHGQSVWCFKCRYITDSGLQVGYPTALGLCYLVTDSTVYPLVLRQIQSGSGLPPCS